MTLEKIENINARLDYIYQIIGEGAKYGLSRTEKSIIELCKIIHDILDSEKIRAVNELPTRLPDGIGKSLLEESEELNRKLLEENTNLRSQLEAESQQIS